jgi:hypothetical protein
VEWRFAQDGWQELDASSRRSSEVARHWRGLCPAVDCSRLMMMMMMTHALLTNPHWARVVGYGPFSLCVIHKQGLCSSSGDINRLMMRRYTQRGSRNISDIPPRHLLKWLSYDGHYRQLVSLLPWSQSISGVSAANPLVAFLYVLFWIMSLFD